MANNMYAPITKLMLLQDERYTLARQLAGVQKKIDAATAKMCKKFARMAAVEKKKKKNYKRHRTNAVQKALYRSAVASGTLRRPGH